MRLGIQRFEPSTVNLDGSQTLEPSNRLTRKGRRFSRRFARRFAGTVRRTLRDRAAMPPLLETRGDARATAAEHEQQADLRLGPRVNAEKSDDL